VLHYPLQDRWEEAQVHPLLGAVRALAEALEHFDDAAARALGVGRSDLRALNQLEHGPLPAGVLAARLGLSSGATTALVDRLVAAGFVARRTAPDDGRKVLVGLQPAVWQAFARVYAPCGAAVATIGEAAPREAAVAEQVLADVAAAVLREAAALEGCVTAPPAGLRREP
jgi:DNA-binding MarR family transcriptional regulator